MSVNSNWILSKERNKSNKDFIKNENYKFLCSLKIWVLFLEVEYANSKANNGRAQERNIRGAQVNSQMDGFLCNY